MEKIEFKLRGKVIRLGREIKGVSGLEFSEITGIDSKYLSKLERESRTISKRNEIRILRGLQEIGVTTPQIVALQLIVENEGGKTQ